MTDCQTLALLLSPYTDGELSPQLTEQVTDHLLTCPSCRERQDTLMALRRAVRQMPVESVSTDFSARFAERLARAQGVAEGESRRPFSGTLAAWAGLFALAAMVVMATMHQVSVSPRPAVQTEALNAGEAIAIDCGLAGARSCITVASPCLSAGACGAAGANMLALSSKSVTAAVSPLQIR